MTSRPTRGDLSAHVQREEMRLLMEDRRFLRFMWRLFGKSGMFLPSSGANPDTSLAEGRRALGIELLIELRLARPDALPLILAEYALGLPGYSTGEPQPPGEDE